MRMPPGLKAIRRKLTLPRLGAIFFILIMVFSAMAVVGDFFSQKKGTSDTTHAGQLGGIDIYKVTSNDYFMKLGSEGVEWHFRANPVEAANVTVSEEANSAIRLVRLGVWQSKAWLNVSGVTLLMEPDADPRVVVSATEVAQALGAARWTPAVAFTKKSDTRSDIPVISIEDATSQSSESLTFYFKTNSTSTGIRRIGKMLILEGADFDALDLAAVRAKIGLLGLV